ncbi:peroxiredoxin family protein [Amycolatopsis sp. H20-H5]|uniref:peroxiredoxin family protein n=1 Tax=Amycolatopsis sp. H20-H5 TaxID=3046309 RepID=UPI002DBF5463|nr:redoxin domain-containing protein [Amycolatopsis sp. H20-H5]MEC3981596.1 redoxin domain-containing protein [Amycolatopsis sp. H20-H5]
MLKIGSTVPDLELQDTDGRAVKLADFHGSEHVLLYFMRSTTCPVCNGHVKDLVSRKDELAARKVRVLVAVPGDRAAAAAWKAKRELPYLVVTGRSGTPHEVVGLTRKVFGAMQQSGSVLIDSHGTVRHAHSATMPVASYDKKGIAEAIRSLDTGHTT